MRKKIRICKLWACTFLFLIYLGCNIPDDPSTNYISEDLDFLATLENLGVSLEDEDTREDYFSNDTDASVNPFGTVIGTVYKDCEIFVSGFSSEGSFFIADDSGTKSEEDDTWINYPNKSTAVDLDGDGYEEVIVMYYNTDEEKLYFREMDYKKSTYSYVTELSQIVEESSYYMENRQTLDTGDIDGDGEPEILAVNSNMVYIYDNDFTLLHSETITPPDSDAEERDFCIRAHCAELTGDEKEEIILVKGSYGSTTAALLSVISWNGTDLSDAEDTSLENLPLYFGAGTVSLPIADFAVGDFNGDGLNDLAISGPATNDSDYLTVRQTTIDDDSVRGASIVKAWEISSQYTDAWFIPVASGDFFFPEASGSDGDKILCGKELYRVNNETLCKSDTELGILPATGMLAVGDVNGDYYGDIIICDHDVLIAYDISDRDILGSPSTIFELTADTGYENTPGSLCLPDLDRDSAVLKFVKHYLSYTDPRLITVITAPPCWNSDIQNLDDTSLSLGTTTSESNTETTEVGVSVSLIAGMSVEAPLWGSAFSTECTTEVTNSLSWAFSSTSVRTVTKEYASSPDDDLVVFSCIPFDTYVYEIISSPAGADQTEARTDSETTYTRISSPRTPQIIAADRSFYDANNGNNDDIKGNIITSTPGKPFSYPTSSEIDTIIETIENDLSLQDCGIFSSSSGDSENITISGVSTGLTSVTIAESEEYSSNLEYELSIGQSVKAVYSSVLLGGGWEFALGYSCSSSFSAETFSTLSLGGLKKVDNYWDYAYKAGILAYPMTYGDQTFTMVTSWVDDL